VLAVVMVVFAIALAFGVARLGHAASDRARADTAADAAALAAAGILARGGSAGSAAAAASETAASNGAQLTRCACAGAKPTVEVHVGDATGRARAEVRYECFADPDGC
jgi:secretion/DNA translocation related TadE-like protein